LGLGSAGGRLLQHLGGDNQRGVRFSVAKLQSTLREISAARTTSLSSWRSMCAARSCEPTVGNWPLTP
jgi:hypothetical protein